MMDLDSPEAMAALRAGTTRIEQLYTELLDAHPSLRGNLAAAGMLVGHGLGVFVANGMTNDQILVHVRAIVAEIRQAHAKIQAAQEGAPSIVS